MKDAIDFLDRIEGHGYGGMADYEVARTTVRDAAAEIERLRAELDELRANLRAAAESRLAAYEQSAESSVMRQARLAAEEVATWSPERKAHAERIVNQGAYGQSTNEKGRPG